jgi:rhamnogalacturonyl hydrolase YesR
MRYELPRNYYFTYYSITVMGAQTSRGEVVPALALVERLDKTNDAALDKSCSSRRSARESDINQSARSIFMESLEQVEDKAAEELSILLKEALNKEERVEKGGVTYIKRVPKWVKDRVT